MPILTWIAVLQFKEEDGFHTYRQPTEDPCEGFQKVLEHEKKGELVSFFLEEHKQRRSIGVSLTTGHFIFSHVFGYHPAPELINFKPVYRLINFRRKHRDMGTAGFDSGVILSKYIVGWQTTINNENIQRMMFIDAETLEITITEKR